MSHISLPQGNHTGRLYYGHISLPVANECVHAQTVVQCMSDNEVQGSNSYSTIVKIIWMWIRRSSKEAVMSDLASL